MDIKALSQNIKQQDHEDQLTTTKVPSFVLCGALTPFALINLHGILLMHRTTSPMLLLYKK
jgi:hypothetical protein